MRKKTRPARGRRRTRGGDRLRMGRVAWQFKCEWVRLLSSAHLVRAASADRQRKLALI